MFGKKTKNNNPRPFPPPKQYNDNAEWLNEQFYFQAYNNVGRKTALGVFDKVMGKYSWNMNIRTWTHTQVNMV